MPIASHSQKRDDAKTTTKQCLEQFKKTRPFEDAVRALRESYTFHQQTPEFWLRGTTFPSGVHLIQLQVFLIKQGYRPSEIQGLPDEVHEIRTYLAEGKTSVKEIQEFFGYATPDDVHRILNGKTNAKNPRIFKRVQGFLAYVREATKQAQKVVPIKEAPTKPNGSKDRSYSSEVARGFVDHMIGSYSSMLILAQTLGIKPADMCDGDRSQLQQLFADFCKLVGITVEFAEHDVGKLMTHGEMKNVFQTVKGGN